MLHVYFLYIILVLYIIVYINTLLYDRVDDIINNIELDNDSKNDLFKILNECFHFNGLLKIFALSIGVILVIGHIMKMST